MSNVQAMRFNMINYHSNVSKINNLNNNNLILIILEFFIHQKTILSNYVQHLINHITYNRAKKIDVRYYGNILTNCFQLYEMFL